MSSPSTRVVLGVDVGGSKTLAAVADLGGAVLGAGRGPGGNRQVVGASGFRAAVDVAAREALAQMPSATIVSTHVGAAGVDFPEDRAELLLAMGEAYGRVDIENDSLLGLHAGSSAGWGGVVVAGFGANAAARDESGTTVFVGGVGWHTGDFGGMATLGTEGLRLAIRSWEGREPPSILGDRICSAGDFGGMDDLYRAAAVYRAPEPLVIARLVMEAAEDGDAVCRALVARAGVEMGLSAGIALRRLGLDRGAPEVVAMGGMVRMAAGVGGMPVGSALLTSLDDELHRIVPRAVLRILDTEPVVGALVAALRAAGVPVRPDDLRNRWGEHVGAR
ncbi:MAG: BadF/BadG/BcrA/BcrD ATPase family protein [Actinomycetota bacterium]